MLALVVTVIRTGAFVATPWLLVPWVITWNHLWAARSLVAFSVYLGASAVMMLMIWWEKKRSPLSGACDSKVVAPIKSAEG